MPHQNTITATVLAQCKHTECTVPKHCSDIAAKKSTNERLKKKKNYVATIAIVPLEQTKSTIAFTHSPNKCHNIFTKHLFSVVVGHSFIFYYFILTYKKLTP